MMPSSLSNAVVDPTPPPRPPHQVVACLEEVEDEGLLVSWTLCRQPSFDLTVSPCKLQRQVMTADIVTADINMVTTCDQHSQPRF